MRRKRGRDVHGLSRPGMRDHDPSREEMQPILDAVGTNLLLPLLQNVLGLQLGQTDISMLGLECRAGSVLVE